MNDKTHNLATALNSDLNWAAFLYVAEELSAEEVRQFEDQLADCEDLQVALIEATRQLACLSNSDATDTQLVAAGQSSDIGVVDDLGASRGLKAFAIAASLAACLAIVVNSLQDSVVVESTRQDQISLSDNQAEGAEPDAEVLLAWLNIPSDEVVDEDPADVEIDSDLSVPDWMLTAVLLEAEDFDESADPSLRSLQSIKGTGSI